MRPNSHKLYVLLFKIFDCNYILKKINRVHFFVFNNYLYFIVFLYVKCVDYFIFIL